MRRKLTAIGGVVAVVGATLAAVAGVGGPAQAAAPTVATDGTKVPHYFGPWPNWALSPLTAPNAVVTVEGDGTGATATATVDPDGKITKIDVVSPGHDYTTATVKIESGPGNTGNGTGATADAVITPTSGVVSYKVTAGGSGYKAFEATVSGTGTGATVSASGGVDAVHIGDGGSGYTMPTVEFDLPDDPAGRIAKAHVDPATLGPNGEVTAVVVDDAGSGYLTPPGVAIHNGTLYDPISGATPATVTATLTLSSVTPVDIGSGYSSTPTVTVTDPTGSGSGAAVTATVDAGGISAIDVTNAGTGYMTYGMKKFQDNLPTTCDPSLAAGATGACPTDPAAKYIPVGVPEKTTYGTAPEADEYVIGLVQYRTSFSSDLPPTLVRGYVQLETPGNAAWSQHYPLTNATVDGSPAKPVTDASGAQVYAVTPPQYLGPFIAATKNRPVRIVFRNLLPTGAEGDLFLPVDSTMMGSGMGPMPMADPTNDGTVLDGVRNPECTQDPKSAMCFKDNRATLHLHGGITPWISDGTPHQWITPTGESTAWPQGVSVQNVPDMNVCNATDDGCQTFYYTNQQSARLMFYHDHSWGITRLNVYAGEAAGYTISDDTEKQLVTSGAIPGAGDTIPLIIQDKTFVPDDTQLALQDPTWDSTRWGTKGSFWYHHVYMPAQNPGDPSGMSAYGRWMYGPWFWPPATGTKYGPIKNPYYDPTCKLDVPSTWTYQTDPFCEPELIPGTPNVSAGMEQFNDTPLVNGVAYPTVTLEPKSYRLRLLNAANDRFFNLQWYLADTRTTNGGDGVSDGSEVELKQTELDAAQTDPNVFPTPVGAGDNTQGPDWVQIANEGGFLPAPAVVDGQQPTTWITDPTRFDVGNVDKHSMLLAPAERADAVVDFSKFAGKTLILYNDAPAAFPARVPSYDYYTGQPDLSPNGAPGVQPGYGPNTRTVMKVKIADVAAAPAFDLAKLRKAFQHTATGTGVFESGQHPVIVGQAAYNTAYGSSFAASSNCNTANTTTTTCDGLVRVDDTSKFSFNTLRQPTQKMTIPLQPKGIHDEMNSSTFDEFGRMQANLGIEAQPPAPGAQNITLYPFVNPATEMIDGTNLPSAEFKVTPISSASDGTQIWRVTHNGVDTHPIHFHLYDVQLINRVTWDNIIIPPDPNELGWKDTVRMAPLEDTIVALRPVIPKVPFEVPNSVRELSPMMADGATAGFNSTSVQGQPTAPIVNRLVNFGWEYVWHCHILSHEEMDMMRPVSLAMPPIAPSGLTRTVVTVNRTQRNSISWADNSITETSFVLQRTSNGTTWTDVGTSDSPLNVPNTHGTRTLVDGTSSATAVYQYRVVARNTVGYGGEHPSMTVSSTSALLTVGTAPAAPTNLTATLQSGAVALTWRDNATNESGFVVQRSTGAGTTAWTTVATVPARNNTGNVTYTDTTATPGSTYVYRVGAVNLAGTAYSNTATVTLPTPPSAPTNVTGTAARQGGGERITVRWTDTSANETGFVVQWSADGVTVAGSTTAGANATTVTTGTITRRAWQVRVGSTNAGGTSWSGWVSVPSA